jgi:hypothetical protein
MGILHLLLQLRDPSFERITPIFQKITPFILTFQGKFDII